MRFNLNPFMRSVDKGIFFPTIATPPESINVNNGVLVAEVGYGYKVGTIQKSGWYFINARASNGSSGYGNSGGACGSVGDAVVYLYEGSKFLMWGPQVALNSRNARLTGYPIPTGSGSSGGGSGQTGALGGGGATPGNYGEDGGGGGGAGGHGGTEHSDGGYGGGGGGFIAGIDTVLEYTESFAVGTVFSVRTVECMVLCAGGGGGFGDNNTPRVGGAGGGAWGNGGSITGTGWTGGSGPGGASFGAGESKGNTNYSGGSRGAWAIRDFSTNTFLSGLGAKETTHTGLPKVQDGTSSWRVRLFWIGEQGPYSPAITTKIDLGSVGGG